jgi:3-oxoacyl-[acyl-carrier protein] reductase
VQDLFGRIQDHYGRVDVLVNNVGGSRNMKIWEMTAEAWDYTIRLNLRSAFLCTRAVLPGMMERKSGNIICLSSGAREGTPWTAEDKGAAAYSTCKAGIHGFIRDLCWELSPYGIRANAVAPGPIATEKNRPMFAEQETRLIHPPSRMVPMARLGEAHEIADAVLFLASDESSYITGVTLDVAGGR